MTPDLEGIMPLAKKMPYPEVDGIGHLGILVTVYSWKTPSLFQSPCDQSAGSPVPYFPRLMAGFLTNEIVDSNGQNKFVVFVPEVPNPTSGKLIIVDPSHVTKLNIPVNESLKSIIALGNSDEFADQLKSK